MLLECQRSRDPEHEACRRLVDLGYTGSARTLDAAGKSRMEIPSIVRTAKYTVEENAARGIRVVPWKPHPRGQADAEE